MTEAKQITCRECHLYDHAAKRCLDGKVNPRYRSDSISIAERFGARILCIFNPWRDALAVRQAEPLSEAAKSLRISERRKQGKYTSRVEITLIDEGD